MAKAIKHNGSRWRNDLSAQEIRSLLDYCPQTGIFTWLPRPDIPKWTGKWAGKVAGRVGHHGYIEIGVYDRPRKAHRLAWLWMTGEWPASDIDHINGDRADNRWENLREATASQNQHNRAAEKRNKSGFKGVSWSKQNKKWQVHIMSRNRRYFVGFYDDKKAAAAAYKKMARALHGEFARK